MHHDYHPDGRSAETTDLVLTRLPSGEFAWLRPAPEYDTVYTLTDAGRHVLAQERLFGPSPNVDQIRRGSGDIAHLS